MNASHQNLKKAGDVPADSDDDDFKYEEVSLEDEWSLTEGEEDLEETVKAIQGRAEASARAIRRPSTGRQQPPAVDDFLRNFLFQMGMTQTLDCFQTEWVEMVLKGRVDAEQVGVVPDVYTETQRLDSELKSAWREREEYRLAASAAAGTLVRVQRARDLHRLQHKRVVQEKNRLIEEMRKLRVQCNSYEPAVRRMDGKYQAVLKQVMLVALERDKALGQVNRHSSQHDTPLCGGEDGAVSNTGEPRVRGAAQPGTQPRPPSSPGRPRRQSSRVQSVKVNAP